MRYAVPDKQLFAPQGELSRERLIAYAHGDLLPHEEHEVELHLVNDPLLSDAAEGLSLPHAIGGLRDLDKPRAAHPSWWQNKWIWPASIVIIGLVTWQAWPTTDLPIATPTDHSSELFHSNSAIEKEVVIMPSIDLAHVEEVRDPAPITSQEPSVEAAPTPIERAQPIESLASKQITFDRQMSDHTDPTKSRPARQNRQLYYLHDLKILHPKELQPKKDPFAALGGKGANKGSDEPFTIGADHGENYLSFMDHALGLFKRGHYKESLSELNVLLAEYPADPNAIFYSGKCRFHLGQSDRAARLFDRSAAHTIEVFREEALWYQALSLDAAGRTQEAKVIYEQVADEGGFYAEKARQKLRN